jgi:diadenosine tetraphosphate (Ap4A) HIT family hydrolase
MASFPLDPRLEADGPVVAELPLCQVRLVDDARFLWAVLIPRRGGLVEILDLPAPDRAVLMEEIAAVGAAVKAASGCAKLNVAALGNMVSQLHVHVIGRSPGDAAWPGPVFGFGVRAPLTPQAMAERLETLRAALVP